MGFFAMHTMTDDSMVEANLLIIRRMAEVLQNPNICGQKSCRSECCVKSGLINVKYMCHCLMVLFYGYHASVRLMKVYSDAVLLVCMFISCLLMLMTVENNSLTQRISTVVWCGVGRNV